MFKKLLMSSIILGAISATVGVGAMSAWTEDTDATGTLASANIDLRSWNAGSTSYEPTSSFTFTPGVLVPNQTATGQTWLKNTGDAGLNIAAPTTAVTSTPNGGCASYLNVTTSGTPGSLAAGAESGQIDINASLDNSTPQTCESQSFTVVLNWVGSTQY